MKNHYLIAAISFTILLLFGCELETELVVISQAEQKILFKDDFSGDLSKWDISKGTWAIQNGKLRGIGNGGGVDGWIYAGDESWTDYEVSFMAYFETGNAEVILRSTGHWQDEYRISIWPEDYSSTGDPYANCYCFSHYKNGVGYIYIDSLNNFDGNRLCPFPITNPVHIKVSIIGNEIKLYINNIFVESIIDPQPLQYGRFGLGVVWHLESSFDDVVVKKL